MINKETSLKEYLKDEIINKIMSGEIKPGDKLLSIRDYSDLHHVSRSVVLNGLKDLSESGLIEKDLNNHYVCKSFNKYDKVETLLYLLNYHNQDELMDDDIRSVLEIKYGLDSLAIDLIGNSLNDSDYIRLKDILYTKLNDKSEDYPKLAAITYMSFMRELYLLTNNTILPLFLNSFLNVPTRIVMDYCNKTKPCDLFKASKDMLEALHDKNIDLAKKIIKDRFFLPLTKRSQ